MDRLCLDVSGFRLRSHFLCYVDSLEVRGHYCSYVVRGMLWVALLTPLLSPASIIHPMAQWLLQFFTLCLLTDRTYFAWELLPLSYPSVCVGGAVQV